MLAYHHTFSRRLIASVNPYLSTTSVDITASNKKGIITYLLVSFGLAWGIWEIVMRAGLSADDPLFQLAILPARFHQPLQRWL